MQHITYGAKVFVNTKDVVSEKFTCLSYKLAVKLTKPQESTSLCVVDIGWRRVEFAQVFGIRLGSDVVSIAGGEIDVIFEKISAFQNVF